MSTEKLNINSALEEVKNASFDEQFKKICESDIDDEDEEDEIFDDEIEDAIEFDDDESEEEPVLKQKELRFKSMSEHIFIQI